MTDSQGGSFWRKHRRQLALAAIPAWIIFIVLAYVATRPRDALRNAVNVLKVGALPVT